MKSLLEEQKEKAINREIGAKDRKAKNEQDSSNQFLESLRKN